MGWVGGSHRGPSISILGVAWTVTPGRPGAGSCHPLSTPTTAQNKATRPAPILGSPISWHGVSQFPSSAPVKTEDMDILTGELQLRYNWRALACTGSRLRESWVRHISDARYVSSYTSWRIVMVMLARRWLETFMATWRARHLCSLPWTQGWDDGGFEGPARVCCVRPEECQDRKEEAVNVDSGRPG